MFKGIMGLLAGAVALAQPVAAQTPDPVQIRTAVLRVDDPGLPPISRLDLMPADLGFAGARLANAFRARPLWMVTGTGAVGALFVGFGAKLATATLE